METGGNFPLKEGEEIAPGSTAVTGEESGEPFLLVKITRGNVSEEEWRGIKDKMGSLLRYVMERKLCYHMIFSLEDCDSLPLSRAADFLRFMAKYQDVFNHCLYATVVLVRSELFRIVLDAAFACSPPIRPLRVFSLSPEAARTKEGVPAKAWEGQVAPFLRETREGKRLPLFALTPPSPTTRPPSLPTARTSRR